jgi:hypothetical protein
MEKIPSKRSIDRDFCEILKLLKYELVSEYADSLTEVTLKCPNNDKIKVIPYQVLQGSLAKGKKVLQESAIYKKYSSDTPFKIYYEDGEVSEYVEDSIIGYVRYFPEQDDLKILDPDSQKDKIMKYAEENGKLVRRIYYEIGTDGNSNNGRFGIWEMLNELVEGETVVFFDLYRLCGGRAVYETFISLVWEKVKEKEGKLVSTNGFNRLRKDEIRAMEKEAGADVGNLDSTIEEHYIFLEMLSFFGSKENIEDGYRSDGLIDSDGEIVEECEISRRIDRAITLGEKSTTTLAANGGAGAPTPELPVDSPVKNIVQAYVSGLESGEHGWFNLDSKKWNAKPRFCFWNRNEEYRIFSSNEDLLKAVAKALDEKEVEKIDGIDVSGYISLELKLQCWRQQENEKKEVFCFCCGIQLKFEEPWEVCHILPVCHGGQDKLNNLAAGCVKCNRGEGGMHNVHAYEYMLLKKMPGLSSIKPGDSKLKAARIITGLIEELKINYPGIPKTILKDLDPSRPIRVRLLAMAQLLHSEL